MVAENLTSVVTTFATQQIQETIESKVLFGFVKLFFSFLFGVGFAKTSMRYVKETLGAVAVILALFGILV